MRGTFDVFIESSVFYSTALESTHFVEASWRRREPVPVAHAEALHLSDMRRGGVPLGSPHWTISGTGSPGPHDHL